MFHKRLLKEFKSNRKMIAGMVISQWIMLLSNVVLMLSVADYISVILTMAVAKNSIYLLLVLIAVIIIRGILSYWNTKLSFETSRQLKQKLRGMIYEKLMCLGDRYRDFMKTSEIVQISTEGVEQLEIYFGKYVPQFFYSMIAPVTLFIIVGTMSLKAAVVLFLCVPLIPAAIVAVQKFAKKMLARYWGTYTELGDSFLECLQGLTTLKIYQADERYAEKMDEESEKFRKVTMRVLIMQLNSISIMDLVAYGGAGIGIILGILEFQSGNVSLSQCFFMIMISAEFFLPMRLLGSFFHIAMNGNAAADKIFCLLDMEEPKQGSCTEVSELLTNDITFENVAFSYDKSKKVLNDVSIHASTGITALVGESGCGKSTMISLMMGENVPEEGKIWIGGRKVSDIASDVLRKKITRVSHDSYLFAGTVGENLMMGNPDASEMEMHEALKRVNMEEFVQANGGLSMELKEKASNLSGGQRQRLGLARALLHDTDIYIFDEAASNVDVESENDIMSVIHELSGKKTVILVSHRLANVVNADKIYVLRNGQVKESGKHEELCGQNGYYNKLYSAQAELERYRKGGNFS
ncbi:MAG: ABC transporter ATP-binding protein/permease [Thermoflexaceae bacterium]|nr:ABC transporter ATP-binding protein/permease [Thermoflexaceae bacterium]